MRLSLPSRRKCYASHLLYVFVMSSSLLVPFSLSPRAQAAIDPFRCERRLRLWRSSDALAATTTTRPALPLPEREAQSSEVRGPPDRSEGPYLQSEGAKIGVGAGPWAGDDRKVFFPVKLLNAGDRRSGEEQRETPPGPRQVPDLAARRESDAGRRHDEPAAVSAGRKVVARFLFDLSRQNRRIATELHIIHSGIESNLTS